MCMMDYKIYAMELTNRCNGGCTWCPREKMTRSQGFMRMSTVLNIAQHMKRIGQNYVALHHMGEPLLHPEIGTILLELKLWGIKTELSTNGSNLLQTLSQLIDTSLVRVRVAVDYFGFTASDRFRKSYFEQLDVAIGELVDNGVDVYVHSLEADLFALQWLKDKYPAITLHTKDFDNWAGQVSGISKLPPGECYFKTKNYVVVLWDGTIVVCCMDFDGKYVLGDINKNPEILVHNTYKLCNTCMGLQFAYGGEWE